MKSVHFVSAWAAVVAMITASVSMAGTPPNPKDLTQGSWELQLDKSHFCRNPPQKSHREIFDAGWGLISVHWTGIDGKGNPMDIHYVYNYNGEKYPSGIDRPANESITYKLVSPSRVEFKHWSKDDKLTQDLVRTVSADGQTMTQTTKFIGGKDEKKECSDYQVFQRQ